MLSKRAEKEFEKLADETVEKAEAIKCDFGDFIEGLKILTERFRDRHQFAVDEARRVDG